MPTAVPGGTPLRVGGRTGRFAAMRPYPADALRAFSVGQVVNDPRNDGPECLAAAVRG